MRFYKAAVPSRLTSAAETEPDTVNKWMALEAIETHTPMKTVVRIDETIYVAKNYGYFATQRTLVTSWHYDAMNDSSKLQKYNST